MVSLPGQFIRDTFVRPEDEVFCLSFSVFARVKAFAKEFVELILFIQTVEP